MLVPRHAPIIATRLLVVEPAPPASTINLTFFFVDDVASVASPVFHSRMS